MKNLLALLGIGGAAYLLFGKGEPSEVEQQQAANTSTFVNSVNAGTVGVGQTPSEVIANNNNQQQTPIPVPLLDPYSGVGLEKVTRQARILAANPAVIDKIYQDLNLLDKIYEGTMPVQDSIEHWVWATNTPIANQYIGNKYGNLPWYEHVVDGIERFDIIVGDKDMRAAAALLELQQYGGKSMMGDPVRMWSAWMRNSGPYGKSASLSSNIDKKEVLFVKDAFLILKNLKTLADKINRALELQAISDLQQVGIRFIN